MKHSQPVAVGIAINLVMSGQYYDIALRDIGLCLSAFGLAKLTEPMQATATGVITSATEERARERLVA